MKLNHPRIILIILLALILSVAGFAQTKDTPLVGTLTTEFTYQGKLTDNNIAANGNYDFEFKLTDANGTVLATLQKFNVPVTNGIFTVRLDYGASPFGSGERFLEIGVRQLASSPFMTLTPRQPITAAPISIFSTSAVNAQFSNFSGDAQKLGGIEANQYAVTTDSRLTDARNPLPGSGSYIQNSNFEQVANFSINGVGSAGILQAANVNALFQYSLGGGKFITAPGVSNLFLGIGSGTGWTTGMNNSFFGKDSGNFNSDGSNNSFFGASSGMNNAGGADNSFFGYKAGASNSSAGQNSFFGSLAGTLNSTGIFNSFFGSGAGRANTTANDNSFFGSGAGTDNNGGANSFFGAFSGQRNSTGGKNSFFGAYSGFNNTTGADNAFFGNSAGNLNVTGKQNSFFGTSAGAFNTADNNSFVGFKAGELNGGGTANSFFGSLAGSGNLSGSGNTFLGNLAGKDNTAGGKNTFVGNFAGAGNFTGGNNTALGESASVFGNVSFATAIGSEAIVSSSNTILLGRQSGDDRVQIPGDADIRGRITLLTLGVAGGSSLCRNGSNQIAACSSSIRYKTNVENFTAGLDLIRRLRPVSFTWKDGGMRDLGFVAEEVAAVEPLMTTYNDKGEIEGVKYDRVSTALVNAVNEQQTQIESQADRIKRQQTVIENQERQLKTQQRQIEALKKLVCSANAQAEFCQEKEPEK